MNPTQFQALATSALVAFFVTCPPNATADEPPDPTALLRGVEQSRLGLKTGKLVVEMGLPLPNGRTVNPTRVTFEFQGEKRTVFQISDARVVAPADRAKAEAETKPGEPVPKGVGTPVKIQDRSAWDGTQYCRYTVGSVECDYRKTEGGTVEYVYDPRLLGIDHDYSINSTLRGSLRLDVIKSIEKPTKDTINGVSVWHVILADTFDSRWDYWIEDSPLFRVHRVMYTQKNGGCTVATESSFPADNPKAVLPKEVITQAFDRGKLRISRKATIVEMEIGAKVDPNVGTLASLKLPVGTIINDTRIHKKLGYWNGKGISVEFIPREPIVVAEGAPPGPCVPVGRIVGLSSLGAAVVGVGIFLL